MDMSDKLNEAVGRNAFGPEHKNTPESNEMLIYVIP